MAFAPSMLALCRLVWHSFVPHVCFGCFTDKVKVGLNVNGKKEDISKQDQLSLDVKNLNLNEEDGKANESQARTFTFDELSAATGNFRSDCFLGEGGFGKVYKGNLENQVGSEMSKDKFVTFSVIYKFIACYKFLLKLNSAIVCTGCSY